MAKAIELLPCPFCGSKAELYGECDMVWAECTNNNCCMAYPVAKFDEPEDAIEAWNKRTSLNEPYDYDEIRRIDDLGRITIPKRMRQMLNISEGDELEIILYPNGVYIKSHKPEKECEHNAQSDNGVAGYAGELL